MIATILVTLMFVDYNACIEYRDILAAQHHPDAVVSQISRDSTLIFLYGAKVGLRCEGARYTAILIEGEK